MIIKMTYCAIQVGLRKKISHFGSSVSQAKGLGTVSVNCTVLGGKEEMVIAQFLS